jgi:3'-phosphoadenosine 5'-phosphosulfate sulfotransferase (PAPS reductase)/FAD synthetase
MAAPTLFPVKPRDPAELERSALAVIDAAFAAGATAVLPLFSGGHDSLAACHVASRHPAFPGEVHHIDTGIGAKRTRAFVEEVCRLFGWALRVWKSQHTYERFVRERGFPGPGRHHWVYARIKERCVRQMLRGLGKTALLTGCRSEESVRRMGHVAPLKIGEARKDGSVRDLKRFWTAPCHDWSAEEQAAYMGEHDLPRNPVKLALGMSGECFCGAFAAPGELDRIRRHCPDVAAEIDRLAGVARGCGTHAAWGPRPPGQKGVVAVSSGPLCSSCDVRARYAGILFEEPG